MNTTSNQMEDFEKKEISLQEFLSKGKEYAFYLFKKSWVLIILIALSVLLGLGYGKLKSTKYTARLSFVVEDGKNPASGLANIAGQFGFDVGSLNSNSLSLFVGDNILMFTKSNQLCRKTLLTVFDTLTGKTLADRYAESYKLKQKWQKDEDIGKLVNFIGLDKQEPDRLKDSLLQSIIKRITLKQLKVEKPEKKSSFVTVEIVTKDELFSKLFCERLVQNAAEIYIQIKVQRQKINVDRLQRRADSIAGVLNNRTLITAVEQEKVLDANPGAKVPLVNVEVSGREKMLLTTLYGEVIKNLEIAKISLNQETPIIQVVDTPYLPLPDDKDAFIKIIFLLLAGSFVLWAFYFTSKFISKNKI
ncbi:MAG: hypothetical protein KF781_06950 [Chitinophagaceae bacterium]|nr:hypothetical protein [Chitinophagaceae bacterium]MCW5904040.1 hypothetical protein [Chitinophagaceae bacterium]